MKRIFVLFFCAIVVFQASAQSEFSLKDRIFFGASFDGLSLVLGSNITYFKVSPHAGYFITPRWSAAIGATYEYYNNKQHLFLYPIPFTGRLQTHIWGGRLFTNYVILNNVNDWIPLGLNFRIFTHAEYEALNYEIKFLGHDIAGREWQHSFLVGGGLRFPTGRRSSMNITLLWSFNPNLNKVYGNGPIIRIGYNF